MTTASKGKADAEPTTTGTALALIGPENTRFPVLFDTDPEAGSMAEIMAENFGDDGFSAGDLDRLIIPSGGGTAWDIPDEMPAREITGILLYQQDTRSYWATKRGEGGAEDGPPDCSSPDGKIGIGIAGEGSEINPTGECADCPFNEYGTALGGGKGKACKQKKDLFVLRTGANLPVHISLPPTSLKPHRKHMMRLASNGRRYYEAVTTIGLEVTKGNGQTYSTATFKVDPTPLEDSEKKAIGAYRGPIIGALQQLAAERAASAQSATDVADGSEPGPGSAGWPAEPQQ